MSQKFLAGSAIIVLTMTVSNIVYDTLLEMLDIPENLEECKDYRKILALTVGTGSFAYITDKALLILTGLNNQSLSFTITTLFAGNVMHLAISSRVNPLKGYFKAHNKGC